MVDDKGVSREPTNKGDYDTNFHEARTKENNTRVDMIKLYGHTMHIENLRTYLRQIELQYITDFEDAKLMTSMRRLIDNGRFENEKTKR